MNLAIMQPYFFPYLGYFQLMASVDEWVVFDDVQFVNKGWVNRNRILHPDPIKGWSYITMPLSGKSSFDKISEISIAESDWRAKIRRQFSFFNKCAPHIDEALEIFDFSVDQSDTNLSAFLSESLRRLAELLGLQPIIHVQSEADWDLGAVKHSGQWALEIADLMCAKRYINPAGGAALFCKKEFAERGIELGFHGAVLMPYPQGGREFLPGLSILDVLMWNGLEGTKKLIQKGLYDFGN